MRGIPFTKVVGAGNDFLLVDARAIDKKMSLSSPCLKELARKWCHRHQGVGADGILLVTPSRKADARMRIFNRDGSEASLCGNGLRCVAWYLHQKDHRGKRFLLETGAGVHPTEIVAKERVRFSCEPPLRVRLSLPLRLPGTWVRVHTVTIGVPHAVLFPKALEKVNLSRLGPQIRTHRFFQPQGTNVDFVRIDSPRQISLRTYERGVEAETLACGTGAVASVVIATTLGKLSLPAKVKTLSGEFLSVGASMGPPRFQGLFLEGPARILFTGVLPS